VVAAFVPNLIASKQAKNAQDRQNFVANRKMSHLQTVVKKRILYLAKVTDMKLNENIGLSAGRGRKPSWRTIWFQQSI
jgi:hypothetical protein